MDHARERMHTRWYLQEKDASLWSMVKVARFVVEPLLVAGMQYTLGLCTSLSFHSYSLSHSPMKFCQIIFALPALPWHSLSHASFVPS